MRQCYDRVFNWISISNEKDGNIAETDIEYNLKIRTTTNLPLSISLLENENNIADITTNVEKDTDGTYFRTIAIAIVICML